MRASVINESDHLTTYYAKLSIYGIINSNL